MNGSFWHEGGLFNASSIEGGHGLAVFRPLLQVPRACVCFGCCDVGGQRTLLVERKWAVGVVEEGFGVQ